MTHSRRAWRQAKPFGSEQIGGHPDEASALYQRFRSGPHKYQLRVGDPDREWAQRKGKRARL